MNNIYLQHFPRESETILFSSAILMYQDGLFGIVLITWINGFLQTCVPAILPPLEDIYPGDIGGDLKVKVLSIIKSMSSFPYTRHHILAEGCCYVMVLIILTCLNISTLSSLPEYQPSWCCYFILGKCLSQFSKNGILPLSYRASV